MALKASGGCLKDIFITETDMIDQFLCGELWGWGVGVVGELGDGTTTIKSSPVQTTATGGQWKTASVGTNHVLALKSDNTLWLWGAGGSGALGQYFDTANRSSPVQLVSGSSYRWTCPTGGSCFSAAIATKRFFSGPLNSIFVWGSNSTGQHGTGNTVSYTFPVPGPSGAWRDIVAGPVNMSGIRDDGTLWSWGSNANGRLGDNTGTNRSSPVQITGGGTWRTVATSSAGGHMAAIKDDGTLWLWGNNGSGQLGDGTTTARSSPVQTVSGGNDWKQVSVGGLHTAAIKNDGSLWLWGSNQFYAPIGQLGDGTSTNRSSPVQTSAGGTNWRCVAAGQYHTIATKTDGTVWGWGLNSTGQLGINASGNRSTPTQVGASTRWRSISSGAFTVFSIRLPGD